MGPASRVLNEVKDLGRLSCDPRGPSASLRARKDGARTLEILRWRSGHGEEGRASEVPYPERSEGPRGTGPVILEALRLRSGGGKTELGFSRSLAGAQDTVLCSGGERGESSLTPFPPPGVSPSPGERE